MFSNRSILINSVKKESSVYFKPAVTLDLFSLFEPFDKRTESLESFVCESNCACLPAVC